MAQVFRSRRSQVAAAVVALLIGGYLIFGSFGPAGGPLGTGQTVVTAQASGSVQGIAGTVSASEQVTAGDLATPYAPTDAQRSASEEFMQRAGAAMRARWANLPASDARVAAAAAPAPASATASPGQNPQVDGTFQVYRNTEINPAAGGLNASSIGEPAVAQSGRYVMETWNWGAARSVNGGQTFAFINPYADMPEFCCDQDVIYDKGRDAMFWLRQGINNISCGAGCTTNRDFISVSRNGFASWCNYDIRPATVGLPGNTWFDFPRLALSNNFLYVNTNVFNTAGGFVTHILMRFALTEMSACAGTPFNYWNFSDGWTPAVAEGAREIMYMGDQIVTNTGLNDQFRVYWIHESDSTLNFVNRTIAPYLFTNGGMASCPVAGGANPCARADQRVTGAAIAKNTPVPNNVGAAADHVHFYWNVRQGNGFAVPYVEHAGFHAGTLLYSSRRYVWNPSFTFWYAAAGVNDRFHVALSMYGFQSSSNPYHVVGIDDDYNTNPPGWEVYFPTLSPAPWTANSSGDYLRSRGHSPQGNAWIMTGASSHSTATTYRPRYMVVQRERDANGTVRFDLF